MQQKDNTITSIVRHLQQKLGYENIVISDHWGADKCAIGVTNIDYKNLVYISTFRKKKNKYFVELQCPAENENEMYKNCGNFDNISVNNVVELVRVHLKIK